MRSYARSKLPCYCKSPAEGKWSEMLRRVDLVLCQFTRHNIPAYFIFSNASSRTKNPVMRIPQYANYGGPSEAFMGSCTRVCWNTCNTVHVKILSPIYVTISAAILLQNWGCVYFTELFQILTKIRKHVGDGGHPYCPHPSFSFLPGISTHSPFIYLLQPLILPTCSAYSSCMNCVL